MANSTPETPQPDKKELANITAKPQEQQEEPPNKGDGRKQSIARNDTAAEGKETGLFDFY